MKKKIRKINSFSYYPDTTKVNIEKLFLEVSLNNFRNKIPLITWHLFIVLWIIWPIIKSCFRKVSFRNPTLNLDKLCAIIFWVYYCHHKQQIRTLKIQETSVLIFWNIFIWKILWQLFHLSIRVTIEAQKLLIIQTKIGH